MKLLGRVLAALAAAATIAEYLERSLWLPRGFAILRGAVGTPELILITNLTILGLLFWALRRIDALEQRPAAPIEKLEAVTKRLTNAHDRLDRLKERVDRIPGAPQ